MEDDRILVQKILENDRQAFGNLVTKYQKMIYATCFRMVRSQSDAEDLSQEVFLEALRSLHLIQKSDDLSGWMYKVALNKSLSFIRKRNPAKSGKNSITVTTSPEFDNKHHFSEINTPYSQLEQEDARRIIFQAIEQLPENQKKVILLHKFDNFSQKEICGQLGLSLVSVESLIYRAKLNLRKSLLTYFKHHYK
jgi:RNA polymerase sigma factor (sigma-70 family)